MSDETLSNLMREERRFDPPAELAEHANVTADAYDEADEDRLAFWAEAGRADRLGRAVRGDARLVGPALREVVRRGQAQRGLQLRGPSRRGRQRRPGRPALGRRAGGRQAHAHLRRPQGRGLPGGQRPDRARRRDRRPGRDLHADDPRDGRRDAGLRPHRSAAHGGVRRLLGRRPRQPGQGLRGEGRHHRRRRLPPRCSRRPSSPPSTRRAPRPTVSSRRCSWSGVPARTSTGTTTATCGGTTPSTARRPSTRPRRSTPSTRST